MLRLITLCLFCVSFLAAAQKTANLLPADNDVPGWSIDKQTTCPKGKADNDSLLYDIIDGGADVYIDRGYIDGIFEGYKDKAGTNTMCIEIYHQGTYDSAVSVYTQTAIGVKAEKINDVGDRARLDTSSLFNYSIELVNGPYFIRINTKKSNETKDAAIDMANLIVDNTAPASRPVINRKGTFAAVRISSISNKGVGFAIDASRFQPGLSASYLIMDSEGSLVARLTSDNAQHVFWDATNDKNIRMPKGNYIFSVSQNGKIIGKQNFVLR